MKSRTILKRATLVTAITVGFLSAAPQSSNAVNLFWDNGAAETTPLWSTLANWEILQDGTGGDPGAVPGASDIAVFNTTPQNNTAQTVNVGVTTSVLGLQFDTSAAITLRGSGNRLLNLGTGGIMKTGSGAVTISSAPSSGTYLNPILTASQTWTNNGSTGAIVVGNSGSTAGNVSLLNAGAQTLTLDGTNTNANILYGKILDGSGVLNIVKNGTGLWELGPYNGSGGSTFTGGVTINNGILSNGSATNANGLGTGTVTLNGGELRGGTASMTISNAINVTADSIISPTRFDLASGVITGFNSVFTSSGTPGNGPTLTIDQHNLAALSNVILGGGATGSWSGFNGTLNIKQSLSNTGTTIFSGTTAAGNDLSNAKLILTTPNNSPVGVNRVDLFVNAAAGNIFKVGELSGTGYLAYQGGGTSTIEVGNLNTNSTYSGVIRHLITTPTTTVGLNKIGTGSLTLGGNSDYTGGTKISNGTLIAGVDAGVVKFLPTDLVSRNAKIEAATDIFTTQDASNLPLDNGFVDGDRIYIYKVASPIITLADYGVTNKALYVKTVSTSTFELYTDPTFTTKVDFTADIATGLRLSMSTSLGAETATSPNRVIQLGTGTDGNNVSLLAGSADASLSVNIARDISVAANTGGTSTIGSTVDGNSVFSGAITLGKNVEITSASTGANTLTVSGAISGIGSGITKVGTGNATLSAINTYTGNTTVSAGTLNITGNHTTGANYSVAANAKLITKNIRASNSLTVNGTATINANGGTAGASKVESLAIGAGGKLNLKDNDLVVGTAANVNAVRAAIATGKTNNAASGITSDMPAFGVSTGFGYALGNDAAISPLLAGSLAGQSYDADSVLVKYTFLGDADLDGDSDLNDLGLWAQSFTGDLGNPAIPATYWTSGDFDYDGDTDLNDLGFWAGTFTGDLGGGAGSLIVNAPGAAAGAIAALNSMGITVVPEPSTFVLASVGLTGLAVAARRRKK